MASSMRISRLLSRSFLSASSTSLFSRGGSGALGAGLSKFSTAAAIEEPIKPPVKVEHTQLLIDGKFVDAATGKTFPTLDPRTGDVISHVAEGDHEDVDRAVAAARKAFDHGPWPKMTAYERQRILLRAADLFEKHNDELAALETWDNGKPYEQSAQIEIPMLVRLFRYYAGWADKIHGLTVPADGPYHVQTLHEPIGVAGQIIPWNFPLVMFAWKVGPALACGNTIVLKTAEQTPLSALYASKLLHEAGLPPGVLNVISGFGPTAGAAIASHMDIDKIDSEQFQKILKYIRSGVESGATLETGGDRFGNSGFYIQPTVFSNVKDDMLIAKEEIFGPVQTILKFKDLDDVIQRANNTHYGLAAGVFTKNINTANTLTRALRVGTVWINCFDTFDAAIPFGGYKMSGQGREKGEYSLKNYLQVKAVVTSLKNPAWL
ncbi:hypothetical protein JHK85_000302 [Glycine max]|nr:hypothetical protein JHK85_000302 [Glycine max]KAG5087687.1 hypothetical protein JHK86_000299 [Glycine max]